ncbi:MAG: hypothetical protein B7Y08_14630 [Rhodospirillales bacterium 24-66-33]|nr:MAG: hypothetical protein B7Y57_11985 [Rhodospirillales bacterium 35-66-84]OYZ94009.1 MAG: hypothetical protein B7Y08_14630 [Rhodospirillales bacterium 24-66-33]OZB22342.1 MAG: hypothetical protein B7X63_23210 [Rhodospirillales bacterium 39-66-50]
MISRQISQRLWCFKAEPVVSTGAERSEAERRDLLSGIGRHLVESRSLHSALRAPVETTEPLILNLKPSVY